MRPTRSLRSRAAARRRQGFTLIEISVVMAVMGTLLLLITATLLGTLRIEQLAAEVSQRLAQQSALADGFREDVGRAAAAPETWDRWTAGPTCLILRMPDGSHVTYQWDDGRLQRYEFAGSGQMVRLLPLGGERLTAEFVRRGSGNLVLTLRLLEGRDGAAVRPLDIAAALGGDLR